MQLLFLERIYINVYTHTHTCIYIYMGTKQILTMLFCQSLPSAELAFMGRKITTKLLFNNIQWSP